MIPDRDVWLAAQLMVKRCGADADTQAAVRVDDLLDSGDAEGAAVWQRIVKACAELLRTDPTEGEDTVH